MQPLADPGRVRPADRVVHEPAELPDRANQPLNPAAPRQFKNLLGPVFATVDVHRERSALIADTAAQARAAVAAGTGPEGRRISEPTNPSAKSAIPCISNDVSSLEREQRRSLFETLQEQLPSKSRNAVLDQTAEAIDKNRRTVEAWLYCESKAGKPTDRAIRKYLQSRGIALPVPGSTKTP